MMLPLTCAECGTVKFFYPSQLNDGRGRTRRFCSPACGSKGRKDSLRSHQCKRCGGQLPRRTRVFCSYQCWIDHQRAMSVRAGQIYRSAI
jgi:hypothetical protein